MREQPYTYKPSPRFFGDGSTYLGVELEVEAPDVQKKVEGLALEERPQWAYAKHDGSLAHTGWELVTHPISLSMWMTRGQVRDYHSIPVGTVLTARYKGETYTATVLPGGRVEWNGITYNSISAAGKAIRGGKSTNGYQFFGLVPRAEVNPTTSFFQLIAKLKALGYNSHDNERCGFHVHVSRKAFSDSGDINNPKFYRFKCLINSDLFRRLSQRTRFDFCQQEPVTQLNFIHCRSRYSAVNITRQTVEVRIFRGNLREDRLRKNMEAVVAAIEFSRDTATQPVPPEDGVGNYVHYTAPSEQEFIDYVNQRADRFPNLVAYIALINVPTITQPTETEVEEMVVAIQDGGNS